MSNFSHLDLHENILKVLKDINFENPTKIQEQAIPAILKGSDLIACAQTGTGKTAAFMLPMLNFIANNPQKKAKGPQVLVLVPTRELAMQVADEAKRFSKYLNQIRTVCVYGGVPYPLQKRMLSKDYDILVATPGRLMDHMERGRISLSTVKVLILDEADRMLDMGFIDAIEEIASVLPAQRQTLLFSATIDKKILPFSKKLLNNPVQIEVEAQKNRQENIEQLLYYVDDRNHKLKILDHLLQTLPINQTIIFTSTIVQTSELSDYLQEGGYKSEALHGDMNQRQRTRTINRLRKGDVQILTATDVAARGIDISTISHVINFDLPFQSEDFIHRIGRTGRAGANGTAITFATYREEKMLSRIYELTGKEIQSFTVPGMEPKVVDKGSLSTKRKRGRRSGKRSLDKPSQRSGGSSRFNDSHDKPFFREERNERSSFREDKKDRSFNREERSDRPFNREEKKDRPFHREQRSDRPFNREERKDRPFFKEDKKERSSFKNEKRDRPFSRDDKKDNFSSSGDNFFSSKKRKPHDSQPFSREKKFGDSSFVKKEGFFDKNSRNKGSTLRRTSKPRPQKAFEKAQW